MYIVSGANGQTGSVVANTLLEKGLPVRVIVRSKEKGEKWKDRGAAVAIANLQDAEALTRAFEGGKVLYLMNPPDYQSEDLVVEAGKVIEAVKTAIKNSPLEKLVVLSSVGAHLASGTGPIVSLHLFEQALKDLTIPTTFVRPPNFLENWNSVLDAVKFGGVLPSFHLPLDAEFPQISTEDVGRVAAEAMQENFEGVQIKELAGFMHSPNEVAEAFSRVLGKPVTAVPVPEDQWLETFRSFATPRNADLLYELYKALNSGVPFETENQIEGSVSIDDYAGKALRLSEAQESN